MMAGRECQRNNDHKILFRAYMVMVVLYPANVFLNSFDARDVGISSDQKKSSEITPSQRVLQPWFLPWKGKAGSLALLF